MNIKNGLLFVALFCTILGCVLGLVLLASSGHENIAATIVMALALSGAFVVGASIE